MAVRATSEKSKLEDLSLHGLAQCSYFEYNGYKNAGAWLPMDFKLHV